MRSSINIREIFNLTQDQLAVFLDVTRSRLALAETGRRHLPTHALLQLAKLEMALRNNTEYPLPEMPETAKTRNQQGLAAMKAHAKQCEQEAQLARQQLADMQAEHQRCTRVLLALGYLLHHTGDDKKGVTDRMWLEILHRQVHVEMEACAPAEQVKVLLRAEALELQAAKALAMKF